MDIEGTLELKTKEYLAQIEKYEKYPVVSSVLAQDSTFRTEVEKFYEFSTYFIPVPRGVSLRVFNFGDDNPKKKGESPKNLVEILNGFNENDFNLRKLQYDSVREDYRRWNSTSRRIIKTAITFGGLLLTLVGIPASVFLGANGYIEMAMSSGLVGLEGAIASWWGAVYYPEPMETNGELKEFQRLCECADRADLFMKEHYRDYFIRKTVKNR